MQQFLRGPQLLCPAFQRGFFVTERFAARLVAENGVLQSDKGKLQILLELKTFEVASLKGILNARTAIEIKVPLALSALGLDEDKGKGKGKTRGVQSGLTLLADEDPQFLPFVHAVCLQEGKDFKRVSSSLRTSLYVELCKHVHDAASVVHVYEDSKLSSEALAVVCCFFEHYSVDYKYVKDNTIIPSPYRLHS